MEGNNLTSPNLENSIEEKQENVLRPQKLSESEKLLQCLQNKVNIIS